MEIGNRLPLDDCSRTDDVIARGESAHVDVHAQRAQLFRDPRRSLVHIGRNHQHPVSVPTYLWRYCNSSVTIPAH
jgi:hypothetical protein